MKLEDMTRELAPYLPPAFCAFVGLANAVKHAPTQRFIGFVSGFGLAVYVAPRRPRSLLGAWWNRGSQS